VQCQLDYLAECFPWNIQRVLDELPATLDETYERILRGIKETKWQLARRILLCITVASRPLQVGELADTLTFDFDSGPIPKFREDWRPKNPVEVVLSTCSTLISLVEVKDSRVIQFAHFSVKEFLMSQRFAEKHDGVSRRYHVSPTAAHTLVAQVCLGILLHIPENVTRASLTQFPLAEYAAEHWFEHARFEGVSQIVSRGIEQLFDQAESHFVAWLRIWDPTLYPSERRQKRGQPFPPRGTPLHYAAFCGLCEGVKMLVIEHPEDVNSQYFDDKSTPLHLASREGHQQKCKKYARALEGLPCLQWTTYLGTALDVVGLSASLLQGSTI
jgi:hypothetical protein